MGRAREWVVREGDGRTVLDIVRRLRGDAGAITKGRVFLGRTRVLDATATVCAGDRVSLAEGEPSPIAPLTVLLQTTNIVAVDKPAGIPTIADHSGGAHALLGRLARQLAIPEARLHATSRLDRGVSGVVLFALNKEAAGRLLHAREEGRYERRYVALADDHDERLPGHATWDFPIGRAADPRLRKVHGRDATVATTHARLVARCSGVALLALSPITGRTHQLRVHASAAGAPLLGDRDYGGPTRLTLPSGRVLTFDRVLLHAARVTIDDDEAGPLELRAPIPAALAEVFRALGGEDGAWREAAFGRLAPE